MVDPADALAKGLLHGADSRYPAVVAFDDKPTTSGRPTGPSARPASSWSRWLVGLLLAAMVAYFLVRAPLDPPGVPLGEGGAVLDPSLLADAEPPPPPPRCRPIGSGYQLGEVASPEGDDEPYDGLEPFGVELGRGTATSAGYAIGVRRDETRDGGSGTYASVLVLDESASQGKLIELGRSRGDVNAPIVVAADGGWVTAVLEPDAGGMSLRLARWAKGSLEAGAELDQGKDESMAYDLALGDSVAVLVWDDVADEGKRGTIVLAAVTVEALEGGEDARVVSRGRVDADTPRLALRPGGFWLAYVARKVVEGDDTDRALPEGRYAAERIDPSWIEVVPLDARGALVGEPRPVTPEDGHVLAYDIDAAADGAAAIAWRDDDTPSGAQGGTVTTALITASGVSHTQLVAEQEDVGMGVPTLVGGWLLLPDDRGTARLAPMSPDGQLLAELREEPAIGVGQILAASGPTLLVVSPSGKGVRLSAIACDREATGSPP